LARSTSYEAPHHAGFSFANLPSLHVSSDQIFSSALMVKKIINKFVMKIHKKNDIHSIAIIISQGTYQFSGTRKYV
jgi:hypothetical protein